MLIAASFYIQPLFAATFTINPNSDIVGEIQYVTVKSGDTLHSISRAHDMGMLEIEEANPGINPNKLTVGSTLTIPSAFILPPGNREGIVLNLAELRVYFFPPDQNNVVMTFPVGVGRLGWRTPVGETKIVQKRENPTWIPPASIRAYKASKGINLPYSIGPGPNNPLGKYAMNFGWTNYRMHGTNEPASVGIRSSSGCIRMYPEDIEVLFKATAVGTKVSVIYEPYKVGFVGDRVYIEAHELFPDQYYNVIHSDKYESLEEVLEVVQYPQRANINWGEVKEQIKEMNGVPVDITESHTATTYKEPVRHPAAVETTGKSPS